MSKRGAEFYLTDRNFNSYGNEDDDEYEGTTFKVASEEVIRQRKIKPLKHRTRPSFKAPSETTESKSAFTSFNFQAPSAVSKTNGNEDLMKKKIKEFSEQICGLNESFVSFLSKSIKEDLVFDIALNIDQYKEKRKEIEKKFSDVIDHLTNNNNKSDNNKNNTSFSSSTPSMTNSFDKKEAKFTYGSSQSENKPASSTFTFSKPITTSSTTTSNTTPASSFKFSTFGTSQNSENKNEKSNITTTTPSFNSKPSFSFTQNTSLNKSNNEKSVFNFSAPSAPEKKNTSIFDNLASSTTTTTQPPKFSFNTSNSTTTTTTTTTPSFVFNKPEENKMESNSTTTTTNTTSSNSTFKPFVFNFGQKVTANSDDTNAATNDNLKTLPKPNFLFGVAPPSKAEIESAANGNDDENAELEQVQLTTGAGEEDEDTVFEIKAKIHHYNVEKKEYVARGVGLLKVNKNKNTSKTRLLARMDNGIVFLNVSLFKEMVITDPANSNQFTFNAMDRVEEGGEVKMVKFVVRVKDKDSAKRLYNIILENK